MYHYILVLSNSETLKMKQNETVDRGMKSCTKTMEEKDGIFTDEYFITVTDEDGFGQCDPAGG